MRTMMWVGGFVGGLCLSACAVSAEGEAGTEVRSKTEDLSLLGCRDTVDCKGGLLCEVAECVLGQCLYLPLLGCDVAPPNVIGTCDSNSQCGDGRGCTLDVCVEAEGLCVHAAVDGCCEDNADCRTDLPCSVGLCLNNRCVLDVKLGCDPNDGASGAIGDDCRSELDCDDQNPCTLDVCAEPLGLCTHVGLAGCERGDIVVDVDLDLSLDETIDEVLDEVPIVDTLDPPLGSKEAPGAMDSDPAMGMEEDEASNDDVEMAATGSCSFEGSPRPGQKLPWLLGILAFLGLARLSSREMARAAAQEKAQKFGFQADSRSPAAVRSE